MDINWIIVAIVLVCAIALIIFLVKRNRKDEEDVIEILHEKDLDDGLKSKEEKEE